MTRYMIRAENEQQFQKAKDLLTGQVRLFVVSDRRLFLSAGDVPNGLQDALRANGLKVRVEHPVFSPG